MVGSSRRSPPSLDMLNPKLFGASWSAENYDFQYFSDLIGGASCVYFGSVWVIVAGTRSSEFSLDAIYWPLGRWSTGESCWVPCVRFWLCFGDLCPGTQCSNLSYSMSSQKQDYPCV